jgi:hypothetical protein
MNDGSLVSVLIPNYNCRRFLAERFRSIEAQSYRNLEILFLDDASTDGSVGYVLALRNSHPIQILTSARNCGPFQQWQRGVGHAHGELIWIAEADDSCAPNFLEDLVAVAMRNRSAGFVYSQSRVVNAEGKTIEETPRYLNEIHHSRWQQDYFAHGADEVSNYLILRNTVPNASACLFRRDALHEVDLGDLQLRLCGDWLGYSRILRRHDVAFLAAPLNYYRQHGKTVRASADRGDLRIRESYVVQKAIAERFSICPEMRELACRFTFQEWRNLQRTGAMPADFHLTSPELLQVAKSFDPSIEQRFASRGAQTLPSLLVQQRSWRTAWRWRSQYQAYRDDQSVTLRMGPCNGDVRFDPISRGGSVIIEQMSFFESISGQSVAAIMGTDLLCCLSSVGSDVDWHIGAKGLHVRREEKPVLLRVICPQGLQGYSFDFEIVLRAEPPSLLASQ